MSLIQQQKRCSGAIVRFSDNSSLHKAAVTPYRIALTGSKNSLSVRVRSHAFLVHSSCGECVSCQVISVLSGPIRWQVLDMFKTSNGRHRIKMYGG